MPQNLQATVFADQIEVRFPFSGFITQVFKKSGDAVTKGQALAQLDTRLLQTELDKELADYEKIRAKFEIFDQEHPNINDDITKFLKVISQADLNSSVKSVELAKARLDQARLICPVNGIVVADGNCRPGLFATPASNSFTILDLDSTRLRAELDTADIAFDATFTLEISGQTITLTPSNVLPLGKKFILDFYFPEKHQPQIGTIFSIKVEN